MAIRGLIASLCASAVSNLPDWKGEGAFMFDAGCVDSIKFADGTVFDRAAILALTVDGNQNAFRAPEDGGADAGAAEWKRASVADGEEFSSYNESGSALFVTEREIPSLLRFSGASVVMRAANQLVEAGAAFGTIDAGMIDGCLTNRYVGTNQPLMLSSRWMDTR